VCDVDALLLSPFPITGSSLPTTTESARCVDQDVRRRWFWSADGAERGQGRAAGPGHVEVQHQRKLAALCLLGPQRGVRSHCVEEPHAESGRSLDHAAAHEERIRIAEVGGHREQVTERLCLLLEKIGLL